MTTSSLKHERTSVYVGWGICLLGMLFYAYEYLLRIEPSVMVEPYRQILGYTSFQVGLLTSLYYFAYTPLQLVVGVFTDHFGPVRTLLWALLMCIVGSAVVGLEAQFWVTGMGRFLIGFGSAFSFIGALKLATLYLPRHQLGVFAGFATAMGMLGGMSGEVGLSHLIHRMGWEAVIHVGTGMGVVLLVLMSSVFRRHASHADLQTTARPPLHWMKGLAVVFAKSRLWLLGLTGCCLFLSLSVFGEMWGVEYMRVAYHVSLADAAQLNAFVFIGWVVGAPLVGVLTERMSERKKLLSMLFSTCVALLVFGYLMFGVSHHTLLMVRFLLFVFGLSCSVEILCFVLARESVDDGSAATAMAFVNMLVMLGGFVVQPLASWLLDMQQGGHAVPTVHDFQLAMLVLPVGLFCAFLMFLYLLCSQSLMGGRDDG